MAMASSAPFAVFFLLGEAFAPTANLLVGNARLAGVQSAKTSAMVRLQAWSNVVQSVRFTADQVREFAPVGDHGIGLDRGVIRGRFNVTLNAGTRRLLRRRGGRLAGAVGRHQRRFPCLDEIGVLALDVAEAPYLLGQPGDLDRRPVVVGAERRQ